MKTYSCPAGHTWRAYPEAQDPTRCYTCTQAGKVRRTYRGKEAR